MMMRDGSVIVPLRDTVMRVETLRRSAVVVCMLMAMRRCGIVVVRVVMTRGNVVAVRVPMISHALHIVVVVAVDNRDVVVILVSLIGQMQHIDRQVMTVVEDRTRERGGRMIDLEGVLHAIQHDDRHLRRQPHAERHAEHGDAALGDCKPLTDHDSSRSRVLEPQGLYANGATHDRCGGRRTPHIKVTGRASGPTG